MPKSSVNEYNQLTLTNGTVISVYGLNERIRDFGFTLDPVSEAAPELLEALQRLVNSWDESKEYRPSDVRMARNVIAKAKGGAAC